MKSMFFHLEQLMSDSEMMANVTINSSLPKIEIPKFSGAPTERARFRDLFVSQVHKRVDLTPTIKFYHFSALLQGEALYKIKSLEVNSANYDVT